MRRDLARVEAMAALAEGGTTLQEIGEYYGITGERVRQLLARRGVPIPRRYGPDVVAIMRHVRAPGMVSLRQVARVLGITNYAVSRAVNALGKGRAVQRLYRWRRHSARRQHWIAWYRALAERLGRLPAHADAVQSGLHPPTLYCYFPGGIKELRREAGFLTRLLRHDR